MEQQVMFEPIVFKREMLSTVPITMKRAKQFLKVHHRHLKKEMAGAKLVIGLQSADHVTLTGVLVIGRPKARFYDDGLTAEVTRTCVVDCKNGNSYLYGVARRICTLMGYKRLITYTRQEESGASLRATGFTMVAVRPPRKNWANSSVQLRNVRDADAEEYVTRCLWEVRL